MKIHSVIFLLVWGGLNGQDLALARQGGESRPPSSAPDEVQVSEAFQLLNDPEPLLLKPHKANEQTLRELAYLRETALRQPVTDAQRKASAESAWLLGLLYLHGAGVPTNSAKAKNWFTLSAHYGEPLASAGLAWCAYEGCLTTPDWPLAQHWARQLATVDLARSLYLQWLLERQLRPLNPNANEGLLSLSVKERALIEKAASAGSVHAMIDLGILASQSHDYRRALTLFEAASAQSEAAGLNASWVRERMAAERRSPVPRTTGKPNASQAEAVFNAARKFHRGDGVSVNYTQAIRLYQQADAAGSLEARRMLSLIYSRTTPEGGLDPIWMRQLSEMDVSSLVPKQDVALGLSALRKEPTPLVDLLPRKWLRLMD